MFTLLFLHTLVCSMCHVLFKCTQRTRSQRWRWKKSTPVSIPNRFVPRNCPQSNLSLLLLLVFLIQGSVMPQEEKNILGCYRHLEKLALVLHNNYEQQHYCVKIYKTQVDTTKYTKNVLDYF